MIRNFVTGIVVGGVVAGAGLGVISQLAPLPPQSAPVAADTAAPVAVAPEVSAVADPAATPVPPKDATPVTVPEGGDVSPAPLEATPPAVLPEVTQPAPMPAQPTLEALPTLPEGCNRGNRARYRRAGSGSARCQRQGGGGATAADECGCAGSAEQSRRGCRCTAGAGRCRGGTVPRQPGRVGKQYRHRRHARACGFTAAAVARGCRDAAHACAVASRVDAALIAGAGCSPRT